MSSVYEEIEVDVVSPKNGTEKYSFPKSVISYYRQFTDSPSEGKGSIKTMLYLQGSEKGLILRCGYNELKNKLNAKTVNVSGLSDEDIEKVTKFVQSLREKNI